MAQRGVLAMRSGTPRTTSPLADLWLVLGGAAGGFVVGRVVSWFLVAEDGRYVRPDEQTGQYFLPAGVALGIIVAAALAAALRAHDRRRPIDEQHLSTEGQGRPAYRLANFEIGLFGVGAVVFVLIMAYYVIGYDKPFNRSERLVASRLDYRNVTTVGDPQSRIGGVGVTVTSNGSFDPTKDVIVPEGFSFRPSGLVGPSDRWASYEGPDPQRQGQVCFVDVKPTTTYAQGRERDSVNSYDVLVMCGMS